jgi:hypothetical protein
MSRHKQDAPRDSTCVDYESQCPSLSEAKVFQAG